MSTSAGVTSTTTAAAARGIVKNVAVPGLANGMDYARLGDSDLIVSKVCSTCRCFGLVESTRCLMDRLSFVTAFAFCHSR